MRRYSVWFEDWSNPGQEYPVTEVRVQSCLTRKGMVRKVRKLNGRVPKGASYRFFGKEA
jgi:hypothetical protein